MEAQRQREKRDVVIVTPVLNDWPSLGKLVAEIDMLEGLKERSVTFVVVDDGSVDIVAPTLPRARGCIEEVRILQLNANQGHQRAIALGLAHVQLNIDASVVVSMDSDGEDRPEDIVTLLEASAVAPRSIIVAERRRRSENLTFKVFYQVYKRVFAFLTGKAISFGNFSLVPGARLPNIVFHPGIWNNLAATLLRSRLPIVLMPTDRGTRYFGSSTMNFTSLMLHGISAISVFTDMVIGRIILFLVFCCVAVAGTIAGIVGLKLIGTLFAIDSFFVPGYATYLIMFFVNLLAVTLFTGFMSVLSLLSARDRAASLPTRLLDDLVRSVAITRREPAARAVAT